LARYWSICSVIMGICALMIRELDGWERVKA